MVALLISAVVVVAIGVVTVEVMTEVQKPATDSAKSRRRHREGSHRRPLAVATAAGRRVAAHVGRATATAGRAVVSTRGGRTVVDSGRHVGHTLAELARSSIAIAPPPAAESTGVVETEVRGPGRVVPLTPAPVGRGDNGSGDDVGRPAEIRENPGTTSASETTDMAHTPDIAGPPIPRSPRGRAVPSRRQATAAGAAVLARPEYRMPEDDFDDAPIDDVDGRRERLYPAWWQRIASFVMLGIIVAALGLGAGTAIGALLAFLYRAVTRSF